MSMTYQLRSLLHYFDPQGQLYKPTICPTPSFSPNTDAEQLYKAMRGFKRGDSSSSSPPPPPPPDSIRLVRIVNTSLTAFLGAPRLYRQQRLLKRLCGTKERTIIDILGRRTSAERLAIRQAYASISQKSLQEALSTTLSGDFRDLAVMLCKTPWEVMAEALYKAMRGYGTKERVLNEILAACSRDDIPELKKAYEQAFPKHQLERDICGDTSGDYRTALLLILEGRMDEPSLHQLTRLTPHNLQDVVNSQMAEFDAKMIYMSGEGRPGTIEDHFVRPLLTLSPWQLYASDQAYLKIHGHSISETISKETSGDLKNLLNARVSYALHRPTFYAKLLHFAIAGPGTKDATLQRILTMRADIDLESIKERYQELYKEPLLKAISEDTSRHYRKLCLKLATAHDTD